MQTIGTRAQLQLSEQQINCNGIKEGRRLREQEQPRNRDDLWMTQFERETCPHCCIAARQPSIRSKPQRMKRDLPKMLHVRKTCRTCTRASECTPKHSLSSPKPQHAPASFKTITTHTRTHNHQSQLQTQAPTTASLNQRSKHSLVALQRVSL